MPPALSPPLRVIQITDSHLFASEQGRLLGLCTQDSLDRVLELVRQEQPRPDLVLATGDLSQDGSAASYRRLMQRLEALQAPVLWVEGNHDHAATLQAVLGEGRHLSPCSEQAGDWTFIMLDSSIPGQVPGRLGPADLDFLRQALNTAGGAHILVGLHHHPVPMGCAWLDAQQVQGAEAFLSLLEQDPRVRAVVWGHVHQAFEGRRGGLGLYAAPSTCVQFRPGCDTFTLDPVGPGYRWFDLHGDGRIVTGVSRVQDLPLTLDPDVTGY